MQKNNLDRAIVDRYCFIPDIIDPIFNLKLCAKARNRKLIHKEFYEKNVIYTHVPKAAGSSLGVALIGSDTVGHFPLKYIKKIDNEIFNRAYKFSFVREPYDRIRSAYNFLSIGGKGKWDNKWISKHNLNNVCFDEFVIDKLDEKLMYSIIHLVPQYEFLTEQDKLLTDYVGKIEEMDESILTIQKETNIILNIKHHNKNELNNIKSESLETKNKIQKLYTKDYEIFGY